MPLCVPPIRLACWTDIIKRSVFLSLTIGTLRGVDIDRVPSIAAEYRGARARRHATMDGRTLARRDLVQAARQFISAYTRVMFTGIVEKTVRVAGVVDGPRFRRLTLQSTWENVRHGQSIAVNGVCLTVAELSAGQVAFDVIPETLAKTNLGLLSAGDAVNVERSLRVGDRIDGHFVQGHVDGVAKLVGIESAADESRLAIEAPHDLGKYLVPKGSITIDGVSLTIAGLRGNVFEVALIPTTLSLTTLGEKQIGWPFNFEADVLAKMIVSFLERREELAR